jgi:hypothetical protein
VLFQKPGLHGEAWFNKNKNYSVDCQVREHNVFAEGSAKDSEVLDRINGLGSLGSLLGELNAPTESSSSLTPYPL